MRAKQVFALKAGYSPLEKELCSQRDPSGQPTRVTTQGMDRSHSFNEGWQERTWQRKGMVGNQGVCATNAQPQGKAVFLGLAPEM